MKGAHDNLFPYKIILNEYEILNWGGGGFKVLKDGVGVFITVNCKSKFLMNAEMCFFVCMRVCRCECACAITKEHRAT